MSHLSLELAISQSIQSWLLNNEPTPIAKQLAQGLNNAEGFRATGKFSIADLSLYDIIPIQALLVYNFVHLLSDRVERALDEMAEESSHV